MFGWQGPRWGRADVPSNWWGMGTVNSTEGKTLCSRRGSHKHRKIRGSAESPLEPCGAEPRAVLKLLVNKPSFQQITPNH
jgi:hypothetical protein